MCRLPAGLRPPAPPARPFPPLPACSFRPGRQEDAHEFLIALLDCLHEASLAGLAPKPTPDLAHTSFVYRIFGGRMRSQVCVWGVRGRTRGEGAGPGGGGKSFSCTPPPHPFHVELHHTRAWPPVRSDQVRRVRLRVKHLRPLHRPLSGDHAGAERAKGAGAVHRGCGWGRGPPGARMGGRGERQFSGSGLQ